MVDVTTMLTSGGVVGFIATSAYALKQFLDWGRERGKDKREGVSSSVYDANTVNALTMNALKEERAEKARIQERMDDLEEENADLRTKLYEQQRTYEEQLFEVRRRFREQEIQSQMQQQQIRELTEKVTMLLKGGTANGEG